ncbi:MAG: hypothetical protein K2L12_03720 [Clostridia bacterium]|nr:hypothetical protein [Clostridia bacterium]
MYEFLKLILTGTRDQRLKRFNFIFVALATLEVIFAVSLLFAAKSVYIAVPAVMSGLLVITGIINTVLAFIRSGFIDSLISEQLASDGLANDELTSARKSLAEKYLTIFGKQKGIYFAILNFPVLIYILSALFSILTAVGNDSLSPAVPILFAIGTVTAIVLAVISASLDTKHRTTLYEQADGEIKTIKRCAGMDESKIEKQSYSARNTATRSQELFLCDPADRQALRKVSKVAGWFGTALMIVFIVITNLLEYLEENAENTYILIGAGCFFGILFVAWICSVIWVETRRRAIYKRNETKLTDSEVDSMRRYLQNEFVKLQKRGNLFFSLFCGISTLIGFILGLVGLLKFPEASLSETIIGCTVFWFIASALIALIIWVIVYCVYRKKVKPVELQLSNMKGL